jgi:hypothetical protein
MDIENSSLYSEVLQITQGGEKPISYYWEAEVHTGEVTTRLLKVTTIQTFRDYEKNFSDEIMLEAAVPLGVYAKVIYPLRNELEVTLYRRPLSEVGDTVMEDEESNTQRYKAVLVLDGLPPVEGTELGQLDQFSLDLQDILKLNFQLFGRTLEKLRIVTVGGIFRKTKPEDVITGILSTESLKIQVIGEKAIDGVDMVPAVNKEAREHIVIPQGTKLVSIPTYIQEKCGGVYPTGIGTYLQDRMWYVYPLFDTTRLKKVERSLTLIKVPKNRFSSIERTYREEGGSVFVIGTDQTNFKDDGSTSFMNAGNGVRLADADQFMGTIAKVVDNKAIISRGKINSEFVITQKEDNSNNTQRSVDKISANSFNDYSRLSSRQGGIYQFVWENSLPTLLFPGMMVRVLYLSGDNIVELNGVLLCVDTLTQLAGIGMTSSRHVSTSALSVFVNRVVDN